jgi:hypothetical protein
MTPARSSTASRRTWARRGAENTYRDTFKSGGPDTR